jgi:hypothetical protein
MKKISSILTLLVLLISCEKKDENEPFIRDETLKPYIKELIIPSTKQPYTGSYYIHVSFHDEYNSVNKSMTFSTLNQSMQVNNTPRNNGLGMSIQEVIFRDPELKEELKIAFCFNNESDTTFNICYADYYYSNHWYNDPGANIFYTTPVEGSDNKYYQYMGIDSSDSYFIITYIGNNRINGKYSCRWLNCCGGGKLFILTGDFSIPDIGYFTKN